jgi:hypothetical protein
MTGASYTVAVSIVVTELAPVMLSYPTHEGQPAHFYLRRGK